MKQLTLPNVPRPWPYLTTDDYRRAFAEHLTAQCLPARWVAAVRAFVRRLPAVPIMRRRGRPRTR